MLLKCPFDRYQNTRVFLHATTKFIISVVAFLLIPTKHLSLHLNSLQYKLILKTKCILTMFLQDSRTSPAVGDENFVLRWVFKCLLLEGLITKTWVSDIWIMHFTIFVETHLLILTFYNNVYIVTSLSAECP